MFDKTVLLLTFSIIGKTFACNSGWFGTLCQFQCHCTNNNCDMNGTCSGNSTCLKEWFGPSCQLQNLAMVYTVIDTIPSAVFDNDEVTCNDMMSQIITISWNISYVFPFLRIKLKQKETVITMLDDMPTITITSYDDTRYKVSHVTDTLIDIIFDKEVTAYRLNISGSLVESICELYISGGRNVALKKYATQSSTFTQYTNVNESQASNAVDGNRTRDWHYGSCSHTNQYYSTHNWTLYLSHVYAVNRYVLYNRIDYADFCCPGRLEPFNIKSYDSSMNVVSNEYVHSGGAKAIYSFVSYTQEITEVSVTNTNVALSICEMEIYGERKCPNGWYGLECGQSCNCADNGVCVSNTGACRAGCRAGFFGEGCSKVCDFGKWGISCRNTCNTNCFKNKCTTENGQCIDGCKDGYFPPLCTDCNYGRWGPDCKSNCSENCLTSFNCAVENGACIGGCSPGFVNPLCTQECEHGRWGPECKFNCSENCLTPFTCAVRKGNCIGGCSPGFINPLCTQECPSGKWGPGCQLTCSDHCLTPNTCDTRNGGCKGGCQPGYLLPFCTQACPNGTFGYNCTESCPSNCLYNDCNEGNKTCTFGCIDGYRRDTCKEALLKDTSTGQDTPLAVIIAPVIAGVVLVSLLIIGFFIWRKRHFTPKKGDDVHTRQQKQSTMVDVINDSNVTQTAQTPAPADISKINTFIRILDLNTFLKTHNKSFFVKQFESVPVPQNVTTEVGLNNFNRNKNRYKDIVPYDHSRVHLEINTDDNEGDYINASYVEGYTKAEKCIASQGPNFAMVNDFIRMLWEQKVDKVVMLTNLIEHAKTKCERYWPEDGEKEFGGIRVKLTTTQVCADYTIRRLELSRSNTQVQHVTQFHFTSWPDTGVPKTPWSRVDFEQRVAAEPTEKPIVVHCSAGVGRTGTFIALCNVMSQAKETGGLDFFQTLVKLRNDRMLMIQTEEQYEFLHRAAQVALLCLGTTVTAANIIERVKELETNNVTGRSNMDKEFEAVCDISKNINESIMAEDIRNDRNGIYLNTSALGQRSHNRFPEIIPPNAYRTRLAKENKDMEDYINAILLPSFQKQNHQIVTQFPLPTTVVDFWRLVTQYNVCIVIAFEGDCVTEDQSVAQYLPKSVDEPLSCAPFEIHTGPVMSESFCEEQTITVHLTKKSKTKSSDDHILKHIRYNLNDLKPENLLNFIKKIQVCAYQKEGVVLYMCRNGAEYSGVACVLKLLLDRMDNDLHLTIPIVVGAVKSIRPQVIPAVEQYKLLYQVLQMYHESSNTYSNFGSAKE